LACSGLLLVCTACTGPAQHDAAPDPSVPVRDFSDEVKAVLRHKTALLEKIAADPIITEAVKASNQKNETLTDSEIKELDKQWQDAKGLDDFIKPFITNPCAEFLVEFQDENPEFPEIFVTDRQGLIVAETNKTSDYYQRDEDWWNATYDGGRGKTHYGVIEYDESARSEAISLYVPVTDSDTEEVIGVIKAVCDITAIKMEL
jgi:hypothetical protein